MGTDISLIWVSPSGVKQVPPMKMTSLRSARWDILAPMVHRDLAGLLLGLTAATAVLAQPVVQQRATEEIAPGIRVRGGGVTIDVGAAPCDPPCAEGNVCRHVCRDGAPEVGAADGEPRRQCAWECVEAEH